jgi:predicted Holliday junction resolvase-like endonuclease
MSAKPSYTWSYSSLDLFKQCPHKYYRLKVKKDITEPLSDAIIYGNEAHKAAEEYIKNGTALPKRFAFMQKSLDVLKAKEGEKLCEFRMGLTYQLEPCKFLDQNVWWRGIADLIVLQPDRAWIVDYKTGKSSKYADVKQLELMALSVFKHFPQVKKVKAGLLFVVANDFVKADFHARDEFVMWRPWFEDTERLQKALELDVWNPRPNFTCKGWCPVTDCTHWEPKRGNK